MWNNCRGTISVEKLVEALLAPTVIVHRTNESMLSPVSLRDVVQLKIS
jgi:hypothetical protein